MSTLGTESDLHRLIWMLVTKAGGRVVLTQGDFLGIGETGDCPIEYSDDPSTGNRVLVAVRRA